MLIPYHYVHTLPYRWLRCTLAAPVAWDAVPEQHRVARWRRRWPESQVTPQGRHRQGSNWQPTARVSSSMPLPTWTRDAVPEQFWLKKLRGEHPHFFVRSVFELSWILLVRDLHAGTLARSAGKSVTA